MNLEWVMCHRDGEPKGQVLEREPGSWIKIELNGPRTGSISINTEERLSRLVHPGRTRMKVRLKTKGNKRLQLNGFIGEPNTSWLHATFPIVDPSIRLLNAQFARVYEAGTEDDFEVDTDVELELSAAMWKKIYASDRRTRQLNDEESFFYEDQLAPYSGIIQGDLADTEIIRSWNPYDLNTVWDSIVEDSKRKNGPDFELQPVDREDGVHCRFNTYHPMQGEVKEEVIFELGHNVVDMEWESTVTDPPLCNRYVLIGQGYGSRAPVYVAENWGSIKTQGLWSRFETAPMELKLDQLEARAKSYVANHAWPSNFFDLVLPVEMGSQAQGWMRDANGVPQPAASDVYGVPPAYGVDYDVGDVVTVRVTDRFQFRLADADPGPKTDFLVRVTAVHIEEVDKYGNCMVTLTVQPFEDQGGATGYEGLIAIDPETS